MIPNSISKKILRSIGELGYSPSDLPKNFSFSGTLKEVLINTHIEKEISVLNSNLLEITMNKADYLSALMTDIYFGKERIEKQSLNINCQVVGNQQPAWIVVSTYYACYFLACDIAKLCGQFITNIPEQGVNQLLTQIVSGNRSQFSFDTNVSFAVNVSLGAYNNEVVLRLTKTAAKPHKVAWTNLYGIIRDINIGTNISFDRLKDIVDSKCERWKLPSTIRNEWNYSSSHYYGEKGDNLAINFLKLIKSQRSSQKLFSNNTLPVTEENITASIVFVYENLKEAHLKTMQQIKLK